MRRDESVGLKIIEFEKRIGKKVQNNKIGQVNVCSKLFVYSLRTHG